MSDKTKIDTNQCIRAILDEYYEVESLDVQKEEDVDLFCTSNNHPIQSILDDSNESYCEQVDSNVHDYCGNKQQINNIAPSTTRSNLSNLDHRSNHDDDEIHRWKVDGTSDCIYNGIEKVETEIISSPPGNTKGGSQLPFENKFHPNLEQDEFDGERQSIRTSSISPFQRDRGVPNEESEQSNNKPKKPFLRKGSRKEPSSLQRANKDVLRKGMRFSNDGKGHGISNDGNSTKQNALAHLEQMQQEQLDDLEKRIERRQQARQEIKQKQMVTCSSSTRSRMNGPLQTKADPNTNKRGLGNDDAKTGSRDDCSSSVSEADDEESDSSDDKSSDAASHEEYSECHQKEKFHGKKLKNESNACGSRHHIRSAKEKSPVRCKDKGNRKNCTRMDLKSPELKEQWQVIKSMRKRQEAALRQAEKEREEAKSWANNERISVQKWAGQQRSLIQKERKRVMNEILASQRKKRHESLEERAAIASESSQKQLRSEIEQLTESLQKQRIDADAAKSRFRLSEKRLKDSISTKEDEIISLKEEIEQLATKYASAQTKIEELSKVRPKVKKKKIEKNKDAQIMESKQSQMHDNTRIDGNDGAASTLSPKHTRQDQDENDLNYINCSENEEKCASEEITLKVKKDEEAIATIRKRHDLIEEPKEEWLNKHINGNDGQTKREDFQDTNSSHDSSMKDKIYDPSKYCSTPQTLMTKENKPTGRDLRNDQQNKSRDFFNNKIHKNHTMMYKNGTQKTSLPDGTIIMRFSNGDVKTTYSTVGIVVYYYAESKTSHTTHPDGLEVFEFASGQVEKHYPNGRKEVSFSDGTQQTFLPNGAKMNTFPDGVNVLESYMGEKVIHHTFDQSTQQRGTF